MSHAVRLSFLENVYRLFPPPRFLSMPAVGVDISDSGIKFLEFGTKRGKRLVSRFGSLPLPEGAVKRGEIVDAGALARVLKTLRDEHRVNFVRVALPEEKAFLFQSPVPALGRDQEIRDAIEFKLEENVPISARDAVFDYEVLPGNKGGETREASVVVYPRAVIESYSEAVRSAGLLPLSFAVEAQAIADAVIPGGDRGTYIVVDFGRARTGLSIVSCGVLHFTSTLDVEGESLTAIIQTHRGVDEAQAVEIKNTEGILERGSNPELHAALFSTVQSLAGEIERYYRFWLSKEGQGEPHAHQVDKVILSGGNANLAGLPEFLSAQLSLPVEVGNVWANAFSLEEIIPPIDRKLSLGYATAVGLALQ